MRLIAYGEDALTLWAINRRLPEILRKLNDRADPKDCQVIFRPSFGRRGGTQSAQFGEFDFILLSANSIYLGESKWDRSPEGEQGGRIELRRSSFFAIRSSPFISSATHSKRTRVGLNS